MSTNLHELDKIKDPDELVKKLVSWDEDEETRYLTPHAENEKNALFYLGKQWLEAKRGIDGQIIFEEEDDRYRPVTNLIARACDLKRSQILGRNIKPKTAPASDKKDDIDTAQISTLALRARQVIDGDAAIDKLTFLHSQVFGTGWRADFKRLIPDESIQKPIMRTVTTEFFRCTNPECGAIDEYRSVCPECGSSMDYESNEEETPELDGMGQPKVEVIPLYEIACENIDPFRMKTSMSPTKEKLKWITDTSLQSIDWIKETFNQKLPGFYPQNLSKLKGVKALPRGLKLSEEFQATIMLVHSSTSQDVYKNTIDAQAKDMEANKTILRKSYFAPTALHKQGRLIIWTPDAVLYDGLPDVPKNPELRRWHPYTPRRWRKHPLRFEGIAYINDGIPINKKLNSLDSMIMEHLDKTACPVLVQWDNVLMNNDDNSEGTMTIKNSPEIPGGGIPTYLQHPQMASEVYKMRDAIIDEFNKQMNITDIMQGFHPAGVDTYRGMELLKDSANSAESETYEEQYEYVKESARLKLALIQECVVAGDAAMLKIMNQIMYDEDFGTDELVTFSGADLGNNLNIVVEESDYLALSTAAEADRVKGLMEVQLLSPEDLADPIVKLTMLRKFGMGQMPMPDKRNIEKAERIINLIEAGRGQEVYSILRVQDNKGIQLRVWNDWVLTSRFDSLPPEIQNTGLAIIKFVEDQLMAAQRALTPPPMGPGGSPPPPNGANPPPMPPQGQGGPINNP